MFKAADADARPSTDELDVKLGPRRRWVSVSDMPTPMDFLVPLNIVLAAAFPETGGY